MTPTSPQGPQKRPDVVFILVLVLGVLSLLCCVGTFAAIAIPNFLKFGAKSKQSEARSSLKALYHAELAWFDEHDTYSESVEELGFTDQRGNRYRYVLSSPSAVAKK